MIFGRLKATPTVDEGERIVEILDGDDDKNLSPKGKQGRFSSARLKRLTSSFFRRKKMDMDPIEEHSENVVTIPPPAGPTNAQKEWPSSPLQRPPIVDTPHPQYPRHVQTEQIREAPAPQPIAKPVPQTKTLPLPQSSSLPPRGQIKNLAQYHHHQHSAPGIEKGSAAWTTERVAANPSILLPQARIDIPRWQSTQPKYASDGSRILAQHAYVNEKGSVGWVAARNAGML